MIRYLLDTNIVIYVFKKRPIEVLLEFKKNSGRMAISSITLAELFHGAEKSVQFQKQKRGATNSLPAPITISLQTQRDVRRALGQLHPTQPRAF